MTDLTKLTPAEIDRELARIQDERHQADARHYTDVIYSAAGATTTYHGRHRIPRRDMTLEEAVDTARERVAAATGEYYLPGTTTLVSTVQHYLDAHDEWVEKTAALASEELSYESEFRRRGGWNRYFLVTNADGHVHRGMNCSTCHLTTQYAWLIDLADCDETKMVEEYGEKACTVCFPDAPTLPGWARSIEEREAADAAKRDAECPGSRTFESDDVNGSKRLYRAWGRCRHCGQGVTLTSTGKMRAHKKEAT